MSESLQQVSQQNELMQKRLHQLQSGSLVDDKLGFYKGQQMGTLQSVTFWMWIFYVILLFVLIFIWKLEIGWKIGLVVFMFLGIVLRKIWLLSYLVLVLMIVIGLLWFRKTNVVASFLLVEFLLFFPAILEKSENLFFDF